MILAVSADICACPRIVASGIYATSSPPTQALSMVKEDQLSPDGPEMDMELQRYEVFVLSR
jgi:hypothetical protein